MYEEILCEYLLLLTTKRANFENNTQGENHLPYYYGFRALGMFVGQFSGGRIIDQFGINRCFYINSVLPFILIFVGYHYRERRHHTRGEEKQSIKEQMDVFLKVIFSGNVWKMIIIVILLNITPAFDTLTIFYFTEILNFSVTDLSDFNTLGTLCYLLALIVYSLYFKKTNPKKFFVGTNLLLWFVNVSFLMVVMKTVERMGWNNKFFCFLNQGISSFVSELNFLPIIAIWCSVSPDNLEATSITLFTGLMTTSYNLSNYIGGAILWGLEID